MLARLPNSLRNFEVSIAVAALALAAFSTHAYAGKKKNAAAPDTKKEGRLVFDINKLVWPNPPAVARIRFLDEFTGEKIDLSSKQPKAKPKQSWMDRLAGTKPQADQDIKIPFQLLRPFGIAVNSKGKIYVADQGVGAIFIFDPETHNVELIGNGRQARFGLIIGLAIDDNDRVFVSDDKFRQVSVFNAKHEQEAAFGADILARPGGIAIDTENRLLYVVDTESDVVDVFDADNFKLLRKIGTPGKKHTLTDPGTFSLPTNVAVDSEGEVYVTDTLNNRVEIFDADGKFVSMFGKSGDGPAYFARPKGIAVDADGHVWVVDAMQDKIKVFNRDGQLLICFGDHGGFPGQFQVAYGIAIDKFNRVLVSEQYRGRVQMFRYVTDAEAEQAKKEMAEKSASPKTSMGGGAPAQAQVAAPK